MGTISLSLPTPGTVVAAGLHVSNYGTLQSLANGGIDNNNFASGLIFDPAKLMQAGATAGQTLVWNGSIWAPSTAGTTYRKATAKDVVNTVVETDLLNGEVTVAAGVLGTTGMLRATLVGDYLNTSGGTKTVTLKIKLGATTLFADTTGTYNSTANRAPWRLQFTIANLASASSQWMAGLFEMGNPTVSPSSGIGDLENGNGNINTFAGSATEDTATSKTLVVTCTHSAADALTSMRLKYALVEVV